MRFRTRLLIALLTLGLIPLIVVGFGVRHEVVRRLTAQYDVRASGLAGRVSDELARESATIGNRLVSLRQTMIDDNRLRLAITQHDQSDRGYLLDYAASGMRLAGLSMLQVQDSAGRILSSGHFRNEFDRVEADLPALLAAAPSGAALVDARTPEGPLRVLVRVDSLRIGGRRVVLVGGMTVDSQFVHALAPDSEFVVTLVTDSTDVAGQGGATKISFPFIGGEGRADTGQRMLRSASFVITHSDSELIRLKESVDRWFAGGLLFGILFALIGANWLAGQVSRPLSRLADLSTRIDLDRLDGTFASNRRDEVGDLSRLLDAMTRRLRSSATRVREAERRATVGDVARQVNHDVKNGLVPIRHVLRHLAQVEREEPERLATVFAERRTTLDASVEYLDALARNYARLSRPIARESCDLNALVQVVASSAAADTRVSVRLELDPHTPTVSTDPLVLRRILDNLVSNALDAAGATRGSVTIGTHRTARRTQDAHAGGYVVGGVQGDGGGGSGGTRIIVSDTGAGMTEAELARAFDDFHTTKPTGTGLGLSIVRRLIGDLGATLRVDSAPGRGTTVEIVFAASTDGLPVGLR